MPLLSIETNQTMTEESYETVIATASKLVSESLNKPENFVMVRMNHNANMLFAGTSQPLAFLQLKSIGLPESATSKLSMLFCDLVETHLGVAKDRIYMEFIDAPRKMWGYNGGTF